MFKVNGVINEEEQYFDEFILYFFFFFTIYLHIFQSFLKALYNLDLTVVLHFKE
jgi:hypothetical protein